MEHGTRLRLHGPQGELQVLLGKERAFTRGANWSNTRINEKLHKFLDMAFYDDPVFGGVCGKFPNKAKMIEFADEYMGQ